VDSGPRPSEGLATLYGKDIQRILENEYGVVYTLDGVYKLLHRLCYCCLKPRPRHNKADPEVQRIFKKTSQNGWKALPKSIQINA
jgi:transposase